MYLSAPRVVRLLFLGAVLLGGARAGAAQELFCTVNINRASLSGSEFVFLDDLQFEVERYLNNRAWTGEAFDERERIDCAVQITFTDAITQTQFRAQIAVQASRPIYGTAQRTPTLQVRDEEWQFSYTRGQALLYDPNRLDPFVSVLDFYANVILGYDFDSFAPLGGTPYFEAARRIAELGRANAGAIGWGSDLAEDRSRFSLVQELLDPAFAPLRQAHFDYHYTVLDQFVLQPEQAWEDALATLTALNELYQQFNRRRYATDVFFGVKFQEIADLLREAPRRAEAYALLSNMDAAHLSAYDALVSGR
jgi:hypothetical protein